MILTTLLAALLVLPPPQQDAADLISRLSSEHIEERDAAGAALEALGEKILPTLEAALAKTKDPEVQARLEKIVGKLSVERRVPRRLVYATGAGKAAELMLLEGGKERRLTNNQRIEGSPRLSPDGARVLYVSIADPESWRESEVVVQDLESGKTVSLGRGIEPAWSPDGKRVLRMDGKEIKVCAADGKDDRVAYSGSDSVRSGIWSGDGTRVACEEGEGVYIVDLESTISRKVAERIDGTKTLSSFDWSRDGRTFSIVAGDGPYFWKLFTVSADNGAITPITANPWIGHGASSWAPDSRHLAVCVRLGSGGGGMGVPAADPKSLDTGLHILDRKEQRSWKAANDPYPILPPRWSPDAQWLVYVAGSGDTLEIKLVSRDGRYSKKLATMTMPVGFAASWFGPDAVWKLP